MEPNEYDKRGNGLWPDFDNSLTSVAVMRRNNDGISRIARKFHWKIRVFSIFNVSLSERLPYYLIKTYVVHDVSDSGLATARRKCMRSRTQTSWQTRSLVR